MKLLLFSLSKALTASNGLSHAIAQLAHMLTEGGHSVSLVCTDTGGQPFFPFPGALRVYNLGLSYKRDKLVKLRVLFARTLEERHRIKYYGYGRKLAPGLAEIIDEEKPDLIICYQIRSALIIKKILSLPVPVILSCHRCPDEIAADNRGLAVAEACDALHVLTQGQAKSIQEKIEGVQRVFVIGNAVSYREEARPGCGSRRIISVGRVTPEKDYLLLINAFHELADEFPDWTIDIWGDTAQSKAYYRACMNRIKRYGLEDRIIFKGVTRNVFEALQSASILAMPSPAEAFPLVLLEGMSAGLPSVGLASCTGVNELITKENGILTEKAPKAYAKGLSRLMRDRALREKMGERARETVAQHSPEACKKRWEELLASLVHDRRQ
ncbi:MAG: glycosyltransferase [Dialister sp.]|nr:glycosyltransferase [Dialister sp.]